MELKINLVKNFLTQIESGRVGGAGAYLSDECTVSGPLEKPMNRQQFLDFQQALLDAFPDWRFNASDMREEGDTVRMKVHVTGTHTGALYLPSLDLEAGPTHKSFSLPEARVTIETAGGKITSYAAEKVPGGGLQGILEQLGITLKPQPVPLSSKPFPY